MRRETVPDSRSSSAKGTGREPNDKLDRASDKTLAEADLIPVQQILRSCWLIDGVPSKV